MSEQNQNNRNGGNNGNRNRNRNRNRNGGQGGGNRNRNNNGNRNNNSGGGNKGEMNASQKRNQLQPSRGPRQRKKPLTLWQKIKKAIGLYKEPEEQQRNERQNNNNRQNQNGQNGKTKTARKNGRAPGGGRVNQGQGRRSGGNNGKGGQRRSSQPSGKTETPRLYVGNLSFDASEHDLEELFKGIGAVRKVELVYNRHTHKSKGYGFINMANLEEAERAIEVLHDQPFMGRKMIVNAARSKGPKDSNENSEGKKESNQGSRSSSAAPIQVPENEEVHSLAPEE